jgi:CheY-like chemotaxis protein
MGISSAGPSSLVALPLRAASPLSGDRGVPTRQPPIDLSRSRWFPSRKADPNGTLPSLVGFTILVVDDDPDALELMHMILESCGAHVLAASTAMHARGYLQTVTPHLIVCDLALPREDGLAFMRFVRASKHPAVARVPAIAVTAFYEDYPPTRAEAFTAYFQKPIDIDTLTSTIASILRSPGPDTDR